MQTAIFYSKANGYTVVGPNGKIKFVNGQYNTSDQEEVDFLDKLAAHPIPGRKIKKIQELEKETKTDTKGQGEGETEADQEPTDEIDWKARADEHELGGGWYKVDGENYQGEDKAIEALKELKS